MKRLPGLIGCGLLASIAQADIPETIGTAELSEPAPHWIWIDDLTFGNLIDGRAYLVDADTGRLLGMLSTGALFLELELPRDYQAIYSTETYYSRGTRGTRTDVISIYDPKTLAFTGEIEIPAKRHTGLPMPHYTTLTDDQRFLVVYNFTPAQSVTVVDLPARRVTSEIATPGCALVYPGGPRRFAMLCADGAVLAVDIGDDGQEKARVRGESFFDPRQDPVTEKGVRLGDDWLFVSFAGNVHEVDVSGAQPRYGEPWPIVTAAELKSDWRAGGANYVALHAASKRLYFIMHKGPVASRKDPGGEVWVFDAATHERLKRVKLASPAVTIAVTQDAAPLLLATAGEGSVEVYDAASGRHLRTIAGVGQTPLLIQPVPAGGR
jgi:methylamine dehydrogenase heavy chain